MTTTLIGVDFLWRNPGPRADVVVEKGMRGVFDSVLDHTAEAIRRQGRDAVDYRDALTCIGCDPVFPAEVRDTDEYRMIRDLAKAIGRGRVAPRLAADLAEVETIAEARSTLALELGDAVEPGRTVEPRPGAHRTVYGADRAWRFHPPGPRRRLELDMGDLERRADRIDWSRVLLLAVLIQVRWDVEVWLETGFLRTARCQRNRCRAFFEVSRMSGRARFCSNVCRASAAREQ